MQGHCLCFGSDLVRVFPSRNQVVDQADDQHAAEERSGVDPVGPVVSVAPGKCGNPFEEDLDERNVEHDASGETGGNREESVIGPLRGKSDDAADSGG